MWLYRRILKISYLDRVTNEEVLLRMQTRPSFVERIAKRKMKYAGHVMRGSSGMLGLNILEGHMGGQRGRGRPRRGWMDDIREWMGDGNASYGYVKRSAENREYWRMMVANITRTSVLD